MTRLPLSGRALVFDVIEDQAYHQRRHGSTRLDGQRLPLRRLHRVGVVRLGEQIELVCRGLARHGHLPDSRHESPMLRPSPEIAMGYGCPGEGSPGYQAQQDRRAEHP